MRGASGSVAIIVQARAGSARLPGKVLMPLVAGRTMLSLMLERLKLSALADVIILATSEERADDAVAAEAASSGVEVFRGSEGDVLSRFVGAAKQFGAGVIVRLCADSPLHDAEIVDRCLREYLDKSRTVDYVSNLMPETFPYGSAVEVFAFDVLLRLDRLSSSLSWREHVTQFLHLNKHLFSLSNVSDEGDHSHLRWAVDYPEDFAFVRCVYEELYQEGKPFSYRDVLALMERCPQLAEINGMRNERLAPSRA